MKPTLPLLFLGLTLALACERDETDLVLSNACRETAPVEGWEQIAFRYGYPTYLIQLPEAYEGAGINVSSEDETFSKVRADGSVRIEYTYCETPRCWVFEEPLARPFPASVIGRDTEYKAVELTRRRFFCNAGDTVGVLYTNDGARVSGRYFFTRYTRLDPMADVQFAAGRREEVEQVLGTID